MATQNMVTQAVIRQSSQISDLSMPRRLLSDMGCSRLDPGGDTGNVHALGDCLNAETAEISPHYLCECLVEFLVETWLSQKPSDQRQCLEYLYGDLALTGDLAQMPSYRRRMDC